MKFFRQEKISDFALFANNYLQNGDTYIASTWSDNDSRKINTLTSTNWRLISASYNNSSYQYEGFGVTKEGHVAVADIYFPNGVRIVFEGTGLYGYKADGTRVDRPISK